MRSFLILLFIIRSSSSALALLGVLSLDTAWASATIWRPQGEVDVLLAVQTNHKGGDVHHLLADTTKNRQRSFKVYIYKFKSSNSSDVPFLAGFIDEEFVTPQKI